MEVSGQLHALAALPSGERTPVTHWIGGWMDPRTGLDDVEKSIFLTHRDSNSDPSAVQSVASRYTDCAISALTVHTKFNKNLSPSGKAELR
jgi:hypothetical protein